MITGATPLDVTYFTNFAAGQKREACRTLLELAAEIERTTAAEKPRLPWLKLAKFGDSKTDKGSLRHDANVISVSGLEADYDGGKIPPDAAVDTLTKAGVAAIVYTSPSHSPDAPRWRVICPFSVPCSPDKRAVYLGRLNGLFGGIFAAESWALSQSYYYGSVQNNPAHKVEIIEGHPIDLRAELDEIWQGKPNTAPAKNGHAAPRAGKVNETELLSEISQGRSFHAAQVRLIGTWATKGVPYIEARHRIVDAMRAIPEAERDARWQSRFDDIDRSLQAIYGKQAAKSDDQTRPTRSTARPPNWTFIDPTSLQNKPIPERDFIVQDWLGAGHVTINYGDGGVGKTLLAQQLLTSAATGKAWCGLAVSRCRAIALFCEDEPDEIHRRQHPINCQYEVDFDDLEDMRWTSGVGEDNTLVEFSFDGTAISTPGLDIIMREAREFQARLIVIDTAADTFGGNENTRREVRKFVGEKLGRLARDLKAAVLLNAHPSRTGMKKEGDLDGGSTAWSNTARARWSLTRPIDEEGTEVDTNERVLTRRKANYASIGDTIRLRWQNGVLVPISAPTGLAGLAASAAAEAVFLDLVAKVTAEGRHVSDSRNSGNYAPKIFAGRPDRNNFLKRDFDAAMQRLFAVGRIKMAEYGRPGANGRPRHIVVEEGPTDG